MVRRLNGSNVRVDEDGVDVALFEGFDSLGSCGLVAVTRFAKKAPISYPVTVARYVDGL